MITDGGIEYAIQGHSARETEIFFLRGFLQPADQFLESVPVALEPQSFGHVCRQPALCGLRLRCCLHIPHRARDSVVWQAALMLPVVMVCADLFARAGGGGGYSGGSYSGGSSSSSSSDSGGGGGSFGGGGASGSW